MPAAAVQQQDEHTRQEQHQKQLHEAAQRGCECPSCSCMQHQNCHACDNTTKGMQPTGSFMQQTGYLARACGVHSSSGGAAAVRVCGTEPRGV